jgi:hypothetical protein
MVHTRTSYRILSLNSDTAERLCLQTKKTFRSNRNCYTRKIFGSKHQNDNTAINNHHAKFKKELQVVSKDHTQAQRSVYLHHQSAVDWLDPAFEGHLVLDSLHKHESFHCSTVCP